MNCYDPFEKAVYFNFFLLRLVNITLLNCLITNIFFYLIIEDLNNIYGFLMIFDIFILFNSP